MNKLSNLQEVQGDLYRTSLLTKMVLYGYITKTEMDATSSYYDAFYQPAAIVYCTNWTAVDVKYQNLASCYTRIGNTLMYPVIVSSGYYSANLNSEDMPKRCTKSTSAFPQNKVLTPEQAASKYYCNLMNFNIGFVYYPTDDIMSNPTPSPLYIPGNPTMKPTVPVPSYRPTKDPAYIPRTPSFEPTQAKPTPVPTSFSPTVSPTKKPTTSPTKSPTRKPTQKAAIARSRLLQFTNNNTEPTSQPSSSPSTSSPTPSTSSYTPSPTPSISSYTPSPTPSTSSYTPSPTPSAGTDYPTQAPPVFINCPSYTATKTMNATVNYTSCFFNASSSTEVFITTCSEITGQTTVGLTYINLYHEGQLIQQNINDTYCSTPASLLFGFTGKNVYNNVEIRQGCYGNTSCSATTLIVLMSSSSGDYYYYSSPPPPPGTDDYFIHTYAPAPPQSPMPSSLTDDYNNIRSDDTMRGQLDDDFVLNSVVEAVDNGHIFSFALKLANGLLTIPAPLTTPSNPNYDAFCTTPNANDAPFNCSSGDIALPSASFDALNSILYGIFIIIYNIVILLLY